jgi:hypothetical protein
MAVSKGNLFSQDFLLEGIQQHPVWKSVAPEESATFEKKLRSIFSKFPFKGNPIEATTENDLIEPIIRALGWSDYLTQQTTARKGRSDVPDYLLFQDADHKSKANEFKGQADRYQHGLSILEAKAWLVPLDRKGSAKDGDGVPSNQMLRYLSSVDVQSNKCIKWGILTNGRYWRLYYQDAQSRSEEFLSLDLPLILGLEGYDADLFEREELKKQDWLKVFYVFFCKQAFIKELDGKSFHLEALEEGKLWEAKVAQNLSDMVFQEVFPGFVNALAKHDSAAPKQWDAAYLTELRHATLTLLYRLLFLLYAEDRNLLPVQDKKYDDYGLRMRVRENIKERIDAKDVFSDSRDTYYSQIKGLCKTIDQGDKSIGIPPYNGGLFDPNRNPILARCEIPDDIFAPLFDRLSRREEAGRKLWINYRDLTVQQLGSIYERLLEFEIVPNDDHTLTIRPNIFARKTSGSYYTPESLVHLVLEKSVGLLCDEIQATFAAKNEELGTRRSSKAERVKDLAAFDPAVKMLALKICDPAMGSGHFLVSLVDYLADRVLEAVAAAEDSVEWDADHLYHSPLADSIQKIRTQIKAQADKHGWIVADDQLDDRHIVRRMILKRCVYGVDKNPMAVELAKVSLWLHTFTVGAPLSFLDHHLRYGDSLFGEFVHGVESGLLKRGSLYINSEVAAAKATAKGMALIEQITDADISEVKESASKFTAIAEAIRPVDEFFSLIHAYKWTDEKDKAAKAAFNAYLDKQFGDPIRIALSDEYITPPVGKKQASLLGDDEPKQQDLMKNGTSDADTYEQFRTLLRQLRQRVEEERFFHWEIAFPGVWEQWEMEHPTGGFDAIIGNPPWDRMKMQEVEWFTARKPEIAYQKRAVDRKKMIASLEKQGDVLYQEYMVASEKAAASMRVAKTSGHYSKMATGDFNIYSLFVERANRLVRSSGYVAFVLPVGIAYDKGNSLFFGNLSETKRINALYVFENKNGEFFKDVHHEDKPTIFVFGGQARIFDKVSCAFFLHDMDQLNDPEKTFELSAIEFSAINPNTKTAPIFRNRRDALIVGKIYENYPIFIKYDFEGLENYKAASAKAKKGVNEEDFIHRVWPVKYFTMLHMTNDSKHFKNRQELEDEGCYPVEASIFKNGDDLFLPVYEGKMIDQYNHRYASVKEETSNVSGQGVAIETTLEQLKDSHFSTAPRYWCNQKLRKTSTQLKWYIGFRDTTNVNNWRTLIAGILPNICVGNTLPLLIPLEGQEEIYINQAPLLLANFNSIVLDYISRQKIQARHINAYILEQLPVIPPAAFEKKLGKTTVGDFIRREVLKLTYTAVDMEPFARDMGYEGKPFAWDEDARRHSKAKLDALFFNLYGINRDDASYILDTFPIVKREDEAQFGRYLTHDLILAYMNALKAGDLDVKIAL